MPDKQFRQSNSKSPGLALCISSHEDSLQRAAEGNHKGNLHWILKHVEGLWTLIKSEAGADLYEVILHHISDDAKLVKVATSALCAKGLLESDLHIADVLVIPNGTQEGIRKPQH